MRTESSLASSLPARVRRSVRIEGIVQGVGFRPHVHRLAVRHRLHGFVRNDVRGVTVEIQGDEHDVDDFLRAIVTVPPAHARIRGCIASDLPLAEETGFSVLASADGPSKDAAVSPDLAACPACLREAFDPSDRRHRYALSSCADCGPRFTAVEALPYDRARTSLARFPLCRACRTEYEDSGDRRFHAEGVACGDCGPRLRLRSDAGDEAACDDPIAEAARRILAGGIVAIKGVGGYHLACDGADEAAVSELRRRKGRDEKPLALMVVDLAAARRLCRVSPAEAELLESPGRPIVLLDRRPDAELAPSVAPGQARLGLLLPYTPLHALLLAEIGARPLVLTSGNVSDEPIHHRDDDALRGLAGRADAFLVHDREILERCDDSVAQVAAGAPVLLRRGRGWVPAPLDLPVPCGRPTLAVGGAFKSVFAFGRGTQALLGHPLGDLDAYDAYRAFVEAVRRYESLFGLAPEVVAHDLHPDYPSTRYAQERGGVRRIAVQHHHAHVASCMAENGLDGTVLGVAFDGSGFGADGTIWGGEFLVADYRGFRRAAHVEAVALPGGDAAVREPWRMAAVYLAAAGEDPGRLGSRGEAILRLRAPRTSSVGRLFDGVAALLGLRDRVSYEGQAAMELEARAQESRATGTYPVELGRDGESWVVRVGPLVGALAADVRRGAPVPDVARRFHATVVEAIRSVCARLREETGLDRVALSGGVFVNRLVLEGAVSALEGDGFRVFRHRRVPPNDGGLCLGQLAVAAAVGG